MLIEWIMNLLKSLLLFIIGLFPALPSSDFISVHMDTFTDVIKSVNRFISVPTLGVCFSAIILCFNARAIWSIVMWVIRKIPGES